MEFIILTVLFGIGYVLYRVMNHCTHDFEFIELQLEKNGKNYTQVMRCRKCGTISTTKV